MMGELFPKLLMELRFSLRRGGVGRLSGLLSLRGRSGGISSSKLEGIRNWAGILVACVCWYSWEVLVCCAPEAWLILACVGTGFRFGETILSNIGASSRVCCCDIGVTACFGLWFSTCDSRDVCDCIWFMISIWLDGLCCWLVVRFGLEGV